MKLFRAKLLATGAILASVAGAGAANISTLSGSQFSEPSQILNTINTLINNINAGTAGLIAATISPVGTWVPASGQGQASELTLNNFVIPGNQLTGTGQSLRARCFGTFAQNNNNKTVKLLMYNTGGATATGAVIASVASNFNSTNFSSWELELVLSYGATAGASTWMGRGSAGQGGLAFPANANVAVTPVVATSAAINFTNSITAQCNGLVGTGSSVGDITGSELSVEQIK